jgi:hypothetical protein
MKITYDREVDALYIRFKEATVTTQHLAEGTRPSSSRLSWRMWRWGGGEGVDVARWSPLRTARRW